MIQQFIMLTSYLCYITTVLRFLLRNNLLYGNFWIFRSIRFELLIISLIIIAWFLWVQEWLKIYFSGGKIRITLFDSFFKLVKWINLMLFFLRLHIRKHSYLGLRKTFSYYEFLLQKLEMPKVNFSSNE